MGVKCYVRKLILSGLHLRNRSRMSKMPNKSGCFPCTTARRTFSVRPAVAPRAPAQRSMASIDRQDILPQFKINIVAARQWIGSSKFWIFGFQGLRYIPLDANRKMRPTGAEFLENGCGKGRLAKKQFVVSSCIFPC